jgi:hypothetical protein
MHETRHTKRPSRAVDNTDWLKSVAILLVAIDHTGHFFIENGQWWSALGRLAAPPFFFLLGYAQTRTVPLHWIGLGVMLTLLESWNADWTFVTLNIIFSFALIRLARPYVQKVADYNAWISFAVFTVGLLAGLPIASKIIDYGAEGWLWALFGFYQRMYIDAKFAAHADNASQSVGPTATALAGNANIIRLLACCDAAFVYIWQEQREYSFPTIHFAAVIFGVTILSLALCQFRRGPSIMQPPAPLSGALLFIGRHTFEIYAIQLACYELIVKFFPDLAS